MHINIYISFNIDKYTCFGMFRIRDWNGKHSKNLQIGTVCIRIFLELCTTAVQYTVPQSHSQALLHS